MSANQTLTPAALLQKLIQFDTTNPPGNERPVIQYIQGLLTEAGIGSQILALDENRPNLIARLPGEGKSAPLLLYGHVDVVTAENQTWTHPPFSGTLEDGYIWGRGALDMKGGVAMLVSAFLKAKAEGLRPPGDVILALVSDEEAGGDAGARFLVEQHPEQFAGVRYALGEFGGFTLTIGGKRFYPIQVAEKQICWLKATLRGTGGHGSLPVRQDGALHSLGRYLQAVTSRRLPVHITPVAQKMLSMLASSVGGVRGALLGQLLHPRLTDSVLNTIGKNGRIFDPLLHNTVSPTIIHTSQKVNVIPSEVSVEMDGRLLPGFKPEDMLAELRRVTTADVTVEVVRFDPGPADPDMGLFDTLAGILREADPQGIPIPLLLSGVTDGRFFSRLGIQTYGYLPMQLPEDFNFSGVIHAADERVPAAAIAFGTQAIFQAMNRF
jgi:acetylornithine deacetylase/succinyl-diaminopimelate desuccinylase-like protein